jgi:TRAP-type C4-dicarboxylate transport system permease small subunit
MHPVKILGLVLLVAGAGLLWFGWQSTEAVTEQIAETLTGRYSDETLAMLIGGAVGVVAGLALLFSRRR